MKDTTPTRVDLPTEPTTPRGTTLATLGFLMCAGATVLLFLATLIAHIDSGSGLFLIASVFTLLGAFLVRRRGTVWKAIAIVLAVLSGLALFWTAFGLRAPDSFLDFVPAVLVMPGLLIAIGGSIAAIRASKDGPESGPGERRAAFAIVTVVGLLVFVSAALTITGRETVDDASVDADAVVTLKEFEFDAEGYVAPSGGTVLVKNQDPFIHTFTVDALDVDVELGPYSETVIELPEADSKTYVLYCDPHTEDKESPSKDDMASELTID